MFHMPMSSPMMTTMLGFLPSALAPGGPAASKSVATAAKGRLIFQVHFIDFLLFLFSSTTEINEPVFTWAELRETSGIRDADPGGHGLELAKMTVAPGNRWGMWADEYGNRAKAGRRTIP